jgi:hypothetical protein
MEYEREEMEEQEDNSDEDIINEYEEEMACLAKFGIKSKEGSLKKVQGRVVPVEVAKFCVGSKIEEQKKMPEIKIGTNIIKEPNKSIPPQPIGRGQKRKRERRN